MPVIPRQTVDYYDNSGGADLKSSPTKVAEDASSSTLNMDYDTDGALFKRYGSLLSNAGNQIPGGDPVLAFYDYKDSDGLERQIIAAGTQIYRGLSNPASFGLTSITSENYPDFEFMVTLDDEYLFWGNGVDTPLKYDGVSWTNWSIAEPSGVPTVATGAVGLLIAGDYDYLVTFARYDLATDTREQESDVFRSGTPPQIQFGSVTNGGSLQNDLSNIPVSTDPQVNARVIYRRISTGANDFRFLAIIPNNTATTYTDNDPVESGPLLALEIDNQAVPNTGIFEEYGGRMFVVNPEKRSDVLYSKVNKPWNVPSTNILIFDGPVQCIKRIYGALLFGTDKSIWIVQGDILSNSPRRISSKIGILNNRCAAGEDTIYILATNLKFYGLRPTDFADDEIRVDAPLSRIVDPRFNQIRKNELDQVQVYDYTKADISKIVIAAPVGYPDNNQLIIFNETQSLAKGKPVWHFWNGLQYNVLGEFTINGDIDLYSGTLNGYIWKLDQVGTDGDGEEYNGTATSGTTTTIVDLLENGTATSGGASTLTDTAKTLTVNAFVGNYLAIVGGTGAGQTIRIQSNTVDTYTVLSPWGVVPDATSVYEVGPFQPSAAININVLIDGGTNDGEESVVTANDHKTLTVSPAFPTAIDNTSEYSLGGYVAYHYSNWKHVLGTYDTLKTLEQWFGNLNTAGTYTIDLIIQFDFDITEANEIRIPLTLNATGAIWNTVNWNEFYWNAVSVFQQRVRQSGRYRAIRIGFQNNRAGQPFQVNGFSIGSFDRGLLFPTA